MYKEACNHRPAAAEGGGSLTKVMWEYVTGYRSLTRLLLAVTMIGLTRFCSSLRRRSAPRCHPSDRKSAAQRLTQQKISAARVCLRVRRPERSSNGEERRGKLPVLAVLAVRVARRRRYGADAVRLLLLVLQVHRDHLAAAPRTDASAQGKS